MMVYVPIIRIPITGWMTIPNTRSLDTGSYTLLEPDPYRIPSS